MRDLWKAGKPFLAGFRRHFWYLLPATFVAPCELYERVIRPNFLSEAWPEHLIVPTSIFPWVLLGTVFWTSFLTYRDLYEEKVRLERVQPKQPETEAHVPISSQITSDNKTKQTEERIPIPANMRLTDLRNFYENRTQMEGDRLISPYINKWKMVTGTVENITPFYDALKYRSVYCYSNEVGLDERGNFRVIIPDAEFRFAEEWTNRIELLRERDNITVYGKIIQIYIINVIFADCELLNQ